MGSISLAEAPDRISNLPDDVLRRILSRLTMKEAATTSILSGRWKYAWIASLTRLVFVEDAFPLCSKIDAFEQMVDGVVHHFPKGVNIDEFCVRFCHDASSFSNIDNWLAFAFSARAARVELDLVRNLYLSGGYSIPIELFHASNYGDRFTSLRELVLTNANVGDRVFKAILSSCASLECLVITDDYALRHAVCMVPLLKLERLTMECHLLKILKIIAPSLVSISYHAFTVASIFIQGAPPLVSLNISSENVYMQGYLLRRFFAHTSQLQCLNLDTNVLMETLFKVPSLHNLTTISLMQNRWISNQYVASILLMACPLLQRLEWHLRSTHGVDLNPRPKHQNLKEIVLTGFTGDEYQMRFLMFLVDNTVKLDSVEVTTNFLEYIQGEGSYRRSFRENKCIHNNKELFEKLSSKLDSILPSNILLETRILESNLLGIFTYK